MRLKSFIYIFIEQVKLSWIFFINLILQEAPFCNSLPQTNKQKKAIVATPKKLGLVWLLISTIGLRVFTRYLFSEIASTYQFGRFLNTPLSLSFIGYISQCYALLESNCFETFLVFYGCLAHLLWHKISGPREEVLFWLSGIFLCPLLLDEFVYFCISNFLTQIWSFKDYNLSIDVFHRLTLNLWMKPRSLFCIFCGTYSLNFVTAIGLSGVKVHCAFLTKTENNTEWKVSNYGVSCGPYFSLFGLNTKI